MFHDKLFHEACAVEKVWGLIRLNAALAQRLAGWQREARRRETALVSM